MSNISTVIILLVVTSVALFVVSMINQRQMRARLVNQKLAQMRRRVTELEELAASLETLVDDLAIPRVVNEEAMDVIQSMMRLAPGNSLHQLAFESVRERNEELITQGRKNPIFRLMESDASIARAQCGLSEAVRIIRKRQAADQVPMAEMDKMLKDLAWANFMIKIASNTAQGHMAINRGDVLRAHAYYRKALEVATEGGHKDPKQNQIISELGEILNGKRRALSTSIMPETHHNPGDDAPTLASLPNGNEDDEDISPF